MSTRLADDDQPKETIATEINCPNPELYRANYGGADVIARCLRNHHHKRILDAELLLAAGLAALAASSWPPAREEAGAGVRGLERCFLILSA